MIFSIESADRYGKNLDLSGRNPKRAHITDFLNGLMMLSEDVSVDGISLARNPLGRKAVDILRALIIAYPKIKTINFSTCNLTSKDFIDISVVLVAILPADANLCLVLGGNPRITSGISEFVTQIAERGDVKIQLVYPSSLAIGELQCPANLTLEAERAPHTNLSILDRLKQAEANQVTKQMEASFQELQKMLVELGKKASVLKSELAASETQLKQEKAKNSIDELKLLQSLTDQQSDKVKKLTASTDSLLNELNAKQTEIDQLQDRCEALSQQLQHAQQLNEKSTAELDNLEILVQQLKDALINQKEKITKLTTQAQASNEQLEIANEQVETLTAAKTDAEISLSDANAEHALAAKKAAESLALTEQSLAEANQQVETLKAEKAAAKDSSSDATATSLLSLKQVLAKANKRVETLKAEKAAAEVLLSEATAENALAAEKAAESLASKEQALTEANKQVETLKGEKAEAEESLSKAKLAHASAAERMAVLLAIAERSLDTANKEVDKLSAEKGKAETLLSEAKTVRVNAAQKVAAQVDAIETANSRVSAAEGQLAELIQARDDLQIQLDEQTVVNDSLQAQLTEHATTQSESIETANARVATVEAQLADVAQARNDLQTQLAEQAAAQSEAVEVANTRITAIEARLSQVSQARDDLRVQLNEHVRAKGEATLTVSAKVVAEQEEPVAVQKTDARLIPGSNQIINCDSLDEPSSLAKPSKSVKAALRVATNANKRMSTQHTSVSSANSSTIFSRKSGAKLSRRSTINRMPLEQRLMIFNANLQAGKSEQQTIDSAKDKISVPVLKATKNALTNYLGALKCDLAKPKAEKKKTSFLSSFGRTKASKKAGESTSECDVTLEQLYDNLAILTKQLLDTYWGLEKPRNMLVDVLNVIIKLPLENSISNILADHGGQLINLFEYMVTELGTRPKDLTYEISSFTALAYYKFMLELLAPIYVDNADGILTKEEVCNKFVNDGHIKVKFVIQLTKLTEPKRSNAAVSQVNDNDLPSTESTAKSTPPPAPPMPKPGKFTASPKSSLGLDMNAITSGNIKLNATPEKYQDDNNKPLAEGTDGIVQQLKAGVQLKKVQRDKDGNVARSPGTVNGRKKQQELRKEEPVDLIASLNSELLNRFKREEEESDQDDNDSSLPRSPK